PSVALLVLRAELVKVGVDAISREQAHEIVLGGQEEARLAGVALASGAAAQLVVDAPGLVALGTADEQASSGHHGLAVGGHLALELGQDLLHAPLVGLRVLAVDALTRE